MCQAFDGELRELRAENAELRRDLETLRYWRVRAEAFEASADAANDVLRTLANALVPFLPQPEYGE